LTTTCCTTMATTIYLPARLNYEITTRMFAISWSIYGWPTWQSHRGRNKVRPDRRKWLPTSMSASCHIFVSVF